MKNSKEKDRDLRHVIGTNGRIVNPSLPPLPECLRDKMTSSMRVEKDAVRVCDND